MEKEIFLPVPMAEYERNYHISNYGRVKSLQRNPAKIINPCIKNGYKNICLSCDGTKKNFQVARLVALTFVYNDDSINKKMVCHIDGVRTNDFSSNLEWVIKLNESKYALSKSAPIRSGTPVRQLSLEGELINVFPSIAEAARITGASEGHIPSVCRGERNECGGFKWEYNDEAWLDEIEEPEGKEIEGYPNYVITREGTVYSKNIGRFMELQKAEDGYLHVDLSNGEPKKRFYVHDLVAIAFLERVSGKNQVNHIDKDKGKDNNHVDNLEWVTGSENMCHHICTNPKTNQVGVIMYDMKGKELKRYDKIRDAASDETRIPRCIDASSIVRVCKGKQTHAGGFLWRYINENRM